MKTHRQPTPRLLLAPASCLVVLGMLIGLTACEAMESVMDELATSQRASAHHDAYGSGSSTMTSPAQGPDGPVIINGLVLDAPTLAALAGTYGVEPVPGSYWYDAMSGMFGAVGQPAAGFMLPGHQLGLLSSNASNGRTGVFVNGRNLPRQEVSYLTALYQTPVLPGRYWLDGHGNVGYEGNPIPMVNLVQLATAASGGGGGSAGGGSGGGGGGGGGDNFWSSRVSAGNWDGNSGYVSVPGYGPVGYGM